MQAHGITIQVSWRWGTGRIRLPPGSQLSSHRIPTMPPRIAIATQNIPLVSL